MSMPSGWHSQNRVDTWMYIPGHMSYPPEKHRRKTLRLGGGGRSACTGRKILFLHTMKSQGKRVSCMTGKSHSNRNARKYKK